MIGYCMHGGVVVLFLDHGRQQAWGLTLTNESEIDNKTKVCLCLTYLISNNEYVSSKFYFVHTHTAINYIHTYTRCLVSTKFTTHIQKQPVLCV